MILETRYRQRGPLMWLTIPFIYGMYLPLVILDLTVRIYQAVCFPIYGVPTIKRVKYVRFDRGELPYLGFVDRINCNYCSYANGVVGYAKQVLVSTESYWCPVHNAPAKNFIEPEHHKDFVPYNDKKALAKRLKDTP